MSFVNTCWIMALIIGYIIMLISLLLGVVLLLLILSRVHMKVKI